MPPSQIALLGAVAGITIYLGLPLGRLRAELPRLKTLLNGIATGGSAAAGDLSLALLLVIGFGLHNATEGFGIVAPMVGTRPSWGYLAVLGLIGGGPTFLGTLVGQAFVNDTVSVAFLGLAAGS